MILNLLIRIPGSNRYAHIFRYILKITLLVITTFQFGMANLVADNPPLNPQKPARLAPAEIDNQRYIGLTIFNFETEARKDDERIENSAASGCNAVEITINWDRVYPSITSTAYWDVVDSHIQTAQRLGLKIALRVHVGRDAERLGGFWSLHETMQAADSSRRINQGIIQFSYSHQPTVELANTFVSEVANRYHYLQEQGQLLFFSVVSSPALESEYSPVYDPPSGNKYVVPYDYSAPELKAFRQYLQARFSLAQLNQRWGTDYSQWSRVMPPANDKANPYASQNGVIGNDWYVFRHRQLKGFIDKINGTVKGIDPAIVVVNQHGCVWDRLSGLRATLAFKNLAQTADGLKFNDGPDYNHRFSMDVVRTNLKPGAFMINAIDGMFHTSVAVEKYYEQIAQCFEHGAKMLTLANFGGMDARPKLTELITMVVNAGLLNQPVTQVQTAGTAVGYKLSDILKSNSIAQERWNQRYTQNGKKPVRIEIDEDLLRNEPPVINSLPVLSQALTDQSALVGQPFSYSIGQVFTDSDGSIVSVDASNLPQGIQWLSSTGEFTGTPTQVEATTVTLTARDNLGAVVTGSFHLTVTDPNRANQPPVAPALTVPIGQVGVVFSYTLPLFKDPEEQPLVYTLKGIAPGLTYTAETGMLSGTPTTAGVYPLTYSAADPSAAQSSVLAQLTIREAAPVVKRTGSFEGFLDTYNCEGDIWGWVWDRNLPNTPMPIEVLDGPTVIGTFTANVNRPDLVAAKKGNGLHGYQFIIPASIKDDKPHVISMRIENSDYYLKGSPRTLTCPSNTAQITDPTNVPPTAISIPIQNAYLKIPFTYTIPEFPHEDGQTLIYALTGGVAGLTFDQSTRTFTGSPSQIGTFTASLIVSDGDGGYTPALVTVVVTAAPANRPPVVSQTISDQTATVGQPFAFTIGAGTFTDPDNNLTGIQASGLPDGLAYIQNSRLVSGTPTNPGVATVTVKATDALSATVVTTFKITVEAAPRPDPVPNKPPVVTKAVDNQTAMVGQSSNFQLLNDTFSDPDGSIVSIAVVGLPAGLTYTQSNRTISGTLTKAETVTITVTATDDDGASVSLDFQLAVFAAPVAENKPPVVAQTIPDQTATVGQVFTYIIGNGVFTDSDGSISKVEIVSSLPDGLTYTPPSRVISGTPSASNTNKLATGIITEPITTTVTVKATDNVGGFVTTTFRLTVNPAPVVENSAPVVAQIIPDQTAMVGQTFNYTIGVGVFTDSDGSIAKVEIVSGLPNGLSYMPSSRIISGTPTASITATVTVKATDNVGGFVTTTFKITVNPAPNVAPVVAQIIPDQTATVGQTFSYIIGAGVFTDSDGSIAKVEIISGLPNGLSYTPGSRVISGTPTAPATAVITVKATDNAGGFVTTTFKLTVNPAPNLAPVVAQAIPDQTATVGQGFIYTIGAGVFTDSDGSIAKVEIVSGLPNGLIYTPGSRLISGIPTASIAATITVKATDNVGGFVTTTFKLTVNPAPTGANQAPVLVKELPDQTATISIAYSYTIGKQHFSDSDGTIVSVDVTNLPNGVSYNKSTGVISGIPTVAQTVAVTVKAVDNKSTTTTVTYSMTVKENVIIKLYKAGKGPEPQNYIQELNNETILMANTLPEMINIFFETATKVSSVKFELKGPKTVLFQENFAPWALCSDNGGIPPLVGIYTLKMIGYKNPNCQGNQLVTRLITFYVKNSGKRENAESSVSNTDNAVWGVYPNPFRDQITVNLPYESNEQLTPVAPYRFSIVSPTGQQLPVSAQDTHIEDGKAILNVQSHGLPSGMHFLQIQRGEGVIRTLKILKE